MSEYTAYIFSPPIQIEVNNMATFSGNVNVSVKGTLTSASVDLGSVAHKVSEAFRQAFANGTAINQANQMFADTRSLALSTSEDLDLAGTLTNGLGETITFTSIKAIIIHSESTNGDTINVGAASSNAFASFLGSATDYIKLRPGGTIVLVNPEANGYAVTAGTGDLLKIDNTDSAAAASYDIILIGEV